MHEHNKCQVVSLHEPTNGPFALQSLQMLITDGFVIFGLYMVVEH